MFRICLVAGIKQKIRGNLVTSGQLSTDPEAVKHGQMEGVQESSASRASIDKNFLN